MCVSSNHEWIIEATKNKQNNQSKKQKKNTKLMISSIR